MKSATFRGILFRYLFGVIIIAAVIRLGLWLGYQWYEVRLGAVVFHEQLTELLLLLLVEVIAIGILGFMLWHLTRRVTSPLRSVANAATLISKGNLEKRIRTAHLPEGELSEIAAALNDSFDRYQETIDRISQFSSAASHQLRTPLAAIRNSAELALADESGKEAGDSVLLSILEEVEHLTRMTEQLLLLSRMESDHLKSEFTKIHIPDLFHRVVDMYQPVLDTKEVVVDVSDARDTMMLGDETLMMEAVMNLFDNALKVSPTGGTIHLRSQVSDKQVIIEVQDAGPGIDPAFRDHLFHRFQRSSTVDYKGTGLGLSIVRQVIKLHGGVVEVHPAHPEGSCFRLSIPHGI